MSVALKRGQAITIFCYFDGTIALFAGNCRFNAKEIVKQEPLRKEKEIRLFPTHGIGLLVRDQKVTFLLCTEGDISTLRLHYTHLNIPFTKQHTG